MMVSQLNTFIFYLTFVFYASFAVYILLMNIHSSRNRTFFFICLTMSVWTYTIILMNLYKDYNTTLMLRRIGTIGWGTMYSFLLHFCIIMTERRHILKNKLAYGAVYLPALINLYVFALSPSIAPKQYDLIWTGTSWINAHIENFLYWYFNIYYLSFSLISIVLILTWGIKTKDYKKKQQSKIILISFIVALGVGTVTDIVLQKFYLDQVPQIGPILIIIPILAVLYSIKKYELMKKPDINKEAEEGSILSDERRIKFYHYLGLTFIILSIGNWVQILFNPEIFDTVVFFSTTLLLIGNILIVIPSLTISQDYQDNIMSIIVAISIPIIMMRFINLDASNMVWPIPLLFLSISSIFNKRRLFWMVAASTLITHAFIVVRAPEITLVIGPSNYLSRTIIYLIGSIGAYAISNIYLKRLGENEEKAKMQQMISNISRNFITLNNKNINLKVVDMIEDIGSYLEDIASNYNCDRVSVVLYLDMDKDSESKYKWDSHKEDVDPKDLKFEKLIPIEGDGKSLGYFKLESIEGQLKLKDHHNEMVKILANITGNAWQK